MGPAIQEESPDCTEKCKSTVHGDIITAAISRRSVTDQDLCSYLNYVCCCCESVWDSAGRTALHVAASCGRVDLVRWLVQNRNANINAKDKESSFTPLHRSIFYGKINVTIELLKLGANTALLDLNSLTMLEHAMKDGFRPESFSGELYVWGSNTNNSIGPQQAKTAPEMLEVFHKRFPGETVVNVCVEKFHSIIIGASGKAYSCGHGQGGRLGLGTQKTVVIPEQINFPLVRQGDIPVTCVQTAISRDHSIFICSDGTVYTCGLNTFRVLGLPSAPQQVLVPTQIKKMPSEVKGVCAGLCHSVAWGDQFLFTWGLNAGQLGHKLLEGDDNKYIIKPKAVKMLNISETQIAAVKSSDGAICIYTRKGDIYVLHEYQCRRVASRQLNVVQLSIFGGKLNSALSKELTKECIGKELKIVALTNTGDLLLWQESDPHICRCIFSLNREIIVKQVMLNDVGLLFVTRDGEAFQGFIKPRKKKTDVTSSSNTSAFHKFLNKADCVPIKITKFPRIHRAIYISSDVKGNDYCVIQVPPYKRFSAPDVIASEMNQRFTTLFKDCNEYDDIHDVTVKIENAHFPAHRCILASKSSFFEKLLEDEDKQLIELPGYSSLIFEQFLLYVYTGNCDLLKCGECPDKLKVFCDKITDPVGDTSPPIDGKLSAFEAYSKNKDQNKQNVKGTALKNPVRMLHEMAKKFGCNDLYNKLSNLEMHKYTIRSKSYKETYQSSLQFDRMSLSNLWDVTINCSDGKSIRAHKCILAAQAEYFNSMFSNRWKGSDVSEISMQYPRNTVEALLEFLYTDTLSYLNNKEPDHLFRLLTLADQFFFTRLKEQCEYLLYHCLSIKNVVQFLILSDTYNGEKLKECCLKFIIANLPPLLELRAFDELDEVLLNQLTDFYFKEKSEIQCRVITPYSTAPLEEEILSISCAYPISLDSKKVINSSNSQKRRSRTNRISETIAFKTDETPKEIIFSEIESPCEIPADGKNTDSPIANRIRAIKTAVEKVTNEDDDEFKFTKLYSKHETLSSSFEDFPLLSSSPNSYSSYSKSPHKSEVGKHRMVKMSQKQRKRLSSESEIPIVAPESPKNPWKIVPNVSSPSEKEEATNMNQIIFSEKKQKENLIKIQSKSLAHTQIEDKAIFDLQKFYNIENIMDELITVERVNVGAVATPVWVPGVRKLD